MARKRPRLAFTPSAEARAHFDRLHERMTQAKKARIGVHATQAEVFDELIRLALQAEARQNPPTPLPPPLQPRPNSGVGPNQH